MPVGCQMPASMLPTLPRGCGHCPASFHVLSCTSLILKVCLCLGLWLVAPPGWTKSCQCTHPPGTVCECPCCRGEVDESGYDCSKDFNGHCACGQGPAHKNSPVLPPENGVQDLDSPEALFINLTLEHDTGIDRVWSRRAPDREIPTPPPR